MRKGREHDTSRRPAEADLACRHKVQAGQAKSALHGTNKLIPAKAGRRCHIFFH